MSEERAPAIPRQMGDIDEAKVREVKANIDKMIGMERVSNQLDGLIANAIVDRGRAKEDLPVNERTMHLVFTGPPGTGKTSVVNQIAPLYHALGLITSPKVKEATGTDLIGSVVGETQEKTQKVLNEAHGGVLFIDEAYKLNDGTVYGQAAVTTLVEDMDKHRNDTVVILAGYPDQIESLMKVNPGLRSRLPTTIHFPAYGPKESQQIGHVMAQAGAYQFAPKAGRAFNRAIAQHATGNARNTRNLWQKVQDAQQRRLVAEHGPEIPRAAHVQITEADVAHGTAAYLAGRPRAKVVKPRKPLPVRT